MTFIKYDDLEMALHFVSGGELLDASVHISRETGQVLWHSDDLDSDVELPENIEDPEMFASVPHRRELGLGKDLALEFALQFIPDEFERVRASFRHEGAFSRFKSLLSDKAVLQDWYEFEQAALRRSLVEWAKREGFSVEAEIEKAT